MPLLSLQVLKELFWPVRTTPKPSKSCRTGTKSRRAARRPGRQWNSFSRAMGAERLEIRSVPSADPITAAAVPVSGFEGLALSNVPVATFTAGNGSEPAANFQAVVVWGDGATSAGTVIQSGNSYIVAGSHTYSDINDNPVVVGIQDTTDAAASAIVTDTAKILPRLPDGSAGTADQLFVYEYLKDLFQRPISIDEVNYWTAQFEKNHRDPQTLSSIVIESTPPFEYRRDEIDSAFQTYLHRAADPQGEAYFLNLVNISQGVRSGPGTERRTSAILIASDEYYNQRSGGTVDGFINAVFEDALKRPATAHDLAYFEFQLTHGMSHVEFATTVLSSYESDVIQINKLYERYLGRPADPYGISAFVFNYNNGYGTETNTETLLDTPEFYNRAAGLPLDTDDLSLGLR